MGERMKKIKVDVGCKGKCPLCGGTGKKLPNSIPWSSSMDMDALEIFGRLYPKLALPHEACFINKGHEYILRVIFNWRYGFTALDKIKYNAMNTAIIEYKRGVRHPDKQK
jgi:hypothetical protein